MKDQLISFETAKLAKEKGFDYKVLNHYKGEELINNGKLYNFNSKEEQKLWNIELISAPTQSLLQRWLREEHKLYILYNFRMKIKVWYCTILSEEENKVVGNFKGLISYEEALEEGLKQALKLIK